MRGQVAQKLQHGDLLRREQEAEDGEDEARVPERVGEPVGVGDGAPGEGTDGGGGEDGALEKKTPCGFVNEKKRERSTSEPGEGSGTMKRVTHPNGDELQLRELPSPPAVQMVEDFVAFLGRGGVRCDEDDGLIRVELEHAIVGESSDIDQQSEKDQGKTLW